MSAKHVCKERGATPRCEKSLRGVLTHKMTSLNKKDDLSGSQPAKGNIRGGLTTIEEKAFGNLQKIGRKSKYVGVLKPAEPHKGKGLWFMDASSATAEAVTLWAASGAAVHLFPTGQRNIIGNPTLPVIKLSANPLTCKTMSEHIDLPVSAILQGGVDTG
jgi:(2R)-sulfolactate sulfo-lyase subunit beta